MNPIIKTVPPSDFWQVAHLEKMLHSDPWELATLTSLPDSLAGFGVLGTYDKTRLVGYLMYQAFDVSELLRLGVDSAYQGRGLGEGLVRAWLDGIQTKTALLEVRADNIAAIGLYHKVGFERLHIRKNYYRDGADSMDGVVMVWGQSF